MPEVEFRPMKSWGDDPLTDDRLGSGRFSSKSAGGDRINLRATLGELAFEAEQLGASDVLIEIDLPANAFYSDGSGIKSNTRTPDFPGVIVRLIGTAFGDLRYACDRFDASYSGDPPGWQANLRAVVLGLQALRQVERYGIGTRGEQYRGWAELPPGTPLGASADRPAMTLERAAAMLAGATDGLVSQRDVLDEPDDARLAFRAAAKRWHPDVPGGSADVWAQVDEAWQLLEKHQGETR